MDDGAFCLFCRSAMLEKKNWTECSTKENTRIVEKEKELEEEKVEEEMNVDTKSRSTIERRRKQARKKWKMALRVCSRESTLASAYQFPFAEHHHHGRCAFSIRHRYSLWENDIRKDRSFLYNIKYICIMKRRVRFILFSLFTCKLVG